MKKCKKCGIEKEKCEENFYRRTPGGTFESICKKCRYEGARNLAKTKPDQYKKVRQKYYLKNREKIKEASKKWRQGNKERFKKIHNKSHLKHPLKRCARKLLNYHIKKGNINRPDVCGKCFKNYRIQAHHDDYSKPLEVRWLCSKCHVMEHYTKRE